MRTCALCGTPSARQPCDPCMTELHADCAQLRTDTSRTARLATSAATLAALGLAASLAVIALRFLG